MTDFEKAVASWQKRTYRQMQSWRKPDRRDYFAALEAWDDKQELSLLQNFLREQTAKTWAKQIARTENA